MVAVPNPPVKRQTPSTRPSAPLPQASRDTKVARVICSSEPISTYLRQTPLYSADPDSREKRDLSPSQVSALRHAAALSRRLARSPSRFSTGRFIGYKGG